MEEVKKSVKYVAYGINRHIPQYNTPSLHAEIAAFKNIKKNNMPRKLDLLVVRFSKEGELVSSRPCYNCIRTLTGSIHIKNVYYSCNGKIIKEKFNEMLDSKLTMVTSGMRMKQRCCHKIN
jgi:tRNA(Arg) A34 adenosine deaminase TadA